MIKTAITGLLLWMLIELGLFYAEFVTGLPVHQEFGGKPAPRWEVTLSHDE